MNRFIASGYKISVFVWRAFLMNVLVYEKLYIHTYFTLVRNNYFLQWSLNKKSLFAQSFFRSETSDKIRKSTFHVKISVYTRTYLLHWCNRKQYFQVFTHVFQYHVEKKIPSLDGTNIRVHAHQNYVNFWLQHYNELKSNF